MFKIGEFSKLTHVTIRMLRHYDEAGLLKPAKIDPITGYRMYSVEQLPMLDKIVYLRDSGLKVAEIKKVLLADQQQIINVLDEKYALIEENIKAEQNKLKRIEVAKKDLLAGNTEMHYHVAIKSIPSYTVLSLRKIIPSYYAEGLLWEELVNFAQQHNIPITTQSFSIYHDLDYRIHGVDVELCTIVEQPFQDIGEFTYRIIETVSIMACSMVYGDFSNIAHAYRGVAEWLAQHDHYVISGANRQIVHRGPWNEAHSEDYLTEIQFPLLQKVHQRNAFVKYYP